MAGFLTDVVNNKLLDCYFGGAPIVPSLTLHVGLSAFQANRAGKVVEPVGGSYARVSLPNDRVHFPDASLGSKYNALPITFPIPSAHWGPVRCLFLADSPVGGNVLAMADLYKPRTIHNGDPALIVAAHALFLLQS